jgi:hypothetical protein
LGVNVEVNFGRERCIFGLNNKAFGTNLVNNPPHVYYESSSGTNMLDKYFSLF